ncbi:unnamed protein product [Caenorhabditis angaria]|uniref:C6 domain-containing protein n=1 Tax=Caenorhabditis angaria TaxID=860376 RepID=A0A9P1IKG4_9PELO|nr:unnamed protein product [Caenorhabditis angaria]
MIHWIFLVSVSVLASKSDACIRTASVTTPTTICTCTTNDISYVDTTTQVSFDYVDGCPTSATIRCNTDTPTLTIDDGETPPSNPLSVTCSDSGLFQYNVNGDTGSVTSAICS